jgi:outer membrane protein OmpA-like peptidoglycan-associated protein
VRADRRATADETTDPNDRHERRGASWYWDDDGSLVLQARLSPDDAAVVLAALAMARDTDQGGSAEPQPEPQQRNADAVVLMARMALTADENNDARSPVAGVRHGQACAVRPMTSRLLAALCITLAISGAACGDDDDSGSDASATTMTLGDDEATTTEPEESQDTTTLLAGQTAGLDDYNDDGENDPTCGMQDFGAGLVLRILCDLSGRNSDPPEGVTLVENSLFRLPTDDQVDLTGISGSAVYARDDAGNRTYIIVFNSDALFETGSDVVAAPDTFDNLIALINRAYPGSRLQVRGHTDSTGSPSANQSLSERRAASAQAYLTSHGVNAAEVTAVGFGQTQPLAREDNDAARQFNRRVEVVIRPPD